MDPGHEPLRLQLIGDFGVAAGGCDVRLTLTAGQLVLGYLALCPRKTESRSKLAATLWEESEEYRARRNLRQVLHSLRTDFAGLWDGIEADRSTVSVRHGSIVSDLDEILEDLRSGIVPDVAIDTPLIYERLLSTVREPGELYASWLRLKRAEFENTLRSLLDKVIGEDSSEQAERAARALLSLDASDEKASRFLIRYHDDRGETGRALDAYAALWDHLDLEYGMEPALPTQQLIADVKSGTRANRVKAGEVGTVPVEAGQTPGNGAATGSGGNFRITILPLSMSDRTEDFRHVGDLFRTELISRLVRFREVSVIDASVRDTQGDYALKLVIASTAEQLALIATLTRTSDGMVIWSDRIEKVAQNWWQHQASLAGRIAAACSLSLSRTRLSEITRMSTVRGAVDNWLLGQKLLNDFRSDSWEQAAVCFRKAISLDPGFSMACSSLSQHHNIGHLVRPGISPDRAMLVASKVLANRAISLDPLDSRAHLCRAWASCLLHEHAQSAASFAMARQCNENDPWTVISSALGSAFNGDIVLASALASQFLQEGWTSTMPQWGYHSNIRFLSGDDEGCVVAAENAGDGIVNLPAWKAAALWHLGENDQAAVAWQSFETKVKPLWVADDNAVTGTILNWFLDCFPIRNDGARKRLADGASGAAKAARA
jgi:DNA-binding SARP family transcriptional activator/TolB-like protein